MTQMKNRIGTLTIVGLALSICRLSILRVLNPGLGSEAVHSGKVILLASCLVATTCSEPPAPPEPVDEKKPTISIGDLLQFDGGLSWFEIKIPDYDTPKRSPWVHGGLAVRDSKGKLTKLMHQPFLPGETYKLIYSARGKHDMVLDVTTVGHRSAGGRSTVDLRRALPGTSITGGTTRSGVRLEPGEWLATYSWGGTSVGMGSGGELLPLTDQQAVLVFYLENYGMKLIADPSGDPGKSIALEGDQPGEERLIAGVSMCWIPPGTFTMGSPEDEPGRDGDEDQVTVKLSHGFWMAKYETTEEQAGQVRTGENLPASSGRSYPMKLAKNLEAAYRQAGWRVTLPTEAQWEYACRAGSVTAHSFGSELAHDNANFDSDGPVPVGSYSPNRWGLHDMHGNMSEWCLDGYEQKLPGGTDPLVVSKVYRLGSDPYHLGKEVLQVVRGGSWGERTRGCRSGDRSYLGLDTSDLRQRIGSRVVVVPCAGAVPGTR